MPGFLKTLQRKELRITALVTAEVACPPLHAALGISLMPLANPKQQAPLGTIPAPVWQMGKLRLRWSRQCRDNQGGLRACRTSRPRWVVLETLQVVKPPPHAITWPKSAVGAQSRKYKPEGPRKAS